MTHYDAMTEARTAEENAMTQTLATVTRQRHYPGFGIALEGWSFDTKGWFHIRWLSGPAKSR